MEVEFHTGIDDKLAFACRLLRKAYRKGALVAVTGAPELLARLDQALWSFEPYEFVPHLRLQRGAAPPARLARTPLWLVEPGAQAPHCEVLVNLGPELAGTYTDFARVIEVVARDAPDRDAGRKRWRAYEAAGVRIKHHPQPAGT